MKWLLYVPAAVVLYLIAASLLGYAVHRLLPDDDD